MEVSSMASIAILSHPMQMGMVSIGNGKRMEVDKE